MWINTKSFRVYRFHSEIRKDLRNVSLPSVLLDGVLKEFDIEPVVATMPPNVDHTKNVSESAPTFDGENWTQTWEVSDASAEEIFSRVKSESNSVRSERDRLLQETDWMVIMHTEQNTNVPEYWKLYRQALRDVPNQAGFPFSVEWPVKPK